MGLKDWRTRRGMQQPVQGEFRITGNYDPNPNGSFRRPMLTGVVTGPGVTPTAAEHLADTDGRWTVHKTVPALVDAADPTSFVLLWDEVPKPDFRAEERARAQQAAQAMTDPTGPTPTGTTPAWATDMLAELTRQGVLPAGTDAQPGAPIVLDLPPQVISGGGLSAAAAAQLSATGEPATAVLLSVSEVPVPQQALPGPTASLCDLQLRVTRAGRPDYTCGTRLGFRTAQRRAAIAVIGASLPVRVDPADPTRVAIDVGAWDATHPGSA